MHQSTTTSLSQIIWPRWESRQFLTVETLLPVTFGYSLSWEAVVMRQLRWKRLWWRSLIRSHKGTSMGPSRSYSNDTISVLQPEEITSKGTRVSCVYNQYKCPYEESGNLFNDPRLYIISSQDILHCYWVLLGNEKKKRLKLYQCLNAKYQFLQYKQFRIFHLYLIENKK